jgi:Putative DNA-binding domain
MELLATFEALSLAVLQDYVSRQQEENLQLDFKTLSEPNMQTGDDKRNLAQMLSAFANSSGGLIVWGVDARPNSNGVDCASGLREIPRVALLLTRLNELDGVAVNPIVGGVRHRIIPTEPGSESGFAVTLVPESETGPHMAKMGEDRYYKRSGHKRYRMEHFDIADMFGRRARPMLELTARSRSNGNEIIFGLKNIGRAVARAPYLAVSCPPPFRRSPYGIDGNRNESIKMLVADNPGPPWRYPASADFVIHPGVTLEIGCLTRENNATPLAAEGVFITFGIACEGMNLGEGTFLVTPAELR